MWIPPVIQSITMPAAAQTGSPPPTTTPCDSSGSACETDAECCGNHCEGFVSVDQPGTCCQPSSLTDPLAACSNDADCCNFHTCNSNGQCCAQSQIGNQASCTTSDECCTTDCVGGTCCNLDGGSCATSADCCNQHVCVGNVCEPD